ncbi:hypothetical protein INR79_09000 [Vibrio sp. SCSIO 43132]|uniref:hypothetical protein n=1 Tax=Vibrio sp. SCSIO 43132 TaxID=2779363 RepID=UPI001CAA031B|nr:hypothetical protein [Vibrio sp. SCSIO 43132]UAB68689.1 hypothetical protein INR79_09000 [Vibrio sp. SCSIO 43132]
MSVSNVEIITNEQMTVSACFFEQRDIWKSTQMKRGSKPLFDFCLDFGIRFEDLIDAGLIEKSEKAGSTSISDYQLTEAGHDFLVAEYESFWVIGTKLEELDSFIENFLHNRLANIYRDT